jgi:outer membrane protein assembly factor BamB
MRKRHATQTRIDAKCPGSTAPGSTAPGSTASRARLPNGQANVLANARLLGISAVSVVAVAFVAVAFVAVAFVAVAFVAVLTVTSAWSAEPSARDLGSRAKGVDWPCFLGPRFDNKSEETGFNFAWSTATPRLVWSRPLGESYGIGSVSCGRYFQFDYVDDNPVLLCLHSETGKLLWEFRYDSQYQDLYHYSPGPRTTPFVEDERVYIQGVEGMLFCLDVTQGNVLWQVDTGAKYGVIQNFFGVGSSPVVYRDLLIAMVGGSPPEDQSIPPGQLDRVSGNGTAIVAFDKHTGQERYRLSHELASYATPQIIAGSDRDWGFAFLRGGLLGFDPRSGREDFFFAWRAKMLESVNASTPVIWDDYVFISETYGPGSALLKYRPAGYDIVWQDDVRRRDKSMQTHWNTPIYHAGFLYGSSGRHASQAELRCIEASTGKVKWSEPGLNRASLLYVDGHLICLGEDGVLRVLRANPERYELISEFTPRDDQEVPLLKYPAWAAPVLSHGLLYVRGKDRLLCYEMPTDPTN